MFEYISSCFGTINDSMIHDGFDDAKWNPKGKGNARINWTHGLYLLAVYSFGHSQWPWTASPSDK